MEGVQDHIGQSDGSLLQETYALQWDASGHLTSDGKLDFEYDPRGRISKITSSSNGVTSYQTNALGQRVRKIEAGNQVTDTVYGEEELGMESYPLGHYRPGDSSQATEYIYLPTASGPMPVAVQIGNELYAIDSDHLNTPRRLTDANGNPVWQWVTTGFGELEPTTAATGFVRSRLNTGTPAIANTAAVEFDLRYPGQQYDAETGLYYNHHRTYDPYLTVGYTQADPIGLAGGANLHSYSPNPIAWIDPWGLAYCSFGNKTQPKGPRPKVGNRGDIHVDENGMVKSQTGETFPEGASTNVNPENAGLGGPYHTIPENTKMPEGLGIMRDGSDVIPGSPHGPGHATIYPTRDMPMTEFQSLFQSLPWEYGGKI